MAWGPSERNLCGFFDWSARLNFVYLLYVEVLLVVVRHAPAHHLYRLKLLEHDRLTALLADAACHEIGIVALTQ
jgi:hypothetical protein